LHKEARDPQLIEIEKAQHLSKEKDPGLEIKTIILEYL